MSPATTTYERLVAERQPKAIHIEREYHDWQRILSRFLAKPDDQLSDAEAAYAETIALLIEAYEKNRYPLPAATPAEALAELLKVHNLRQKDLVDVFGSEAGIGDRQEFLREIEKEAESKRRKAIPPWEMPSSVTNAKTYAGQSKALGVLNGRGRLITPSRSRSKCLASTEPSLIALHLIIH
jgi:HTH-type transcriptional regulator / antitoxin HigA